MKKAIVLLAVLLAVVPVLAQETQPGADQQKAMAAYMKMGAVNENHEFLKKYSGNWDAQVKGWMAPGQPPTVNSGTFQSEMRLGGHFVLMNFRGQMFGQPFEGLEIIGFDNMQKKYVTLWIDNTSTFFFMTSGTRQDNVINESGFWTDPLTGAQVPVKVKTTWVSADDYTYEQFMTMPDGSEFKSMEIRSKRGK
jgi:hypothetical protein